MAAAGLPPKQTKTSPRAALELGPSFGQKRYLEAAHPQARDTRIVFDDTSKWNEKKQKWEQRHDYYVQWQGSDPNAPFDNHYVKSVTTFVHEFFPTFDPDKVIAKMRASKSWSRSKYRGMSDIEIKDEWERNGLDARTNGSKLHNCIEMFYNGELECKEKPRTADWKQFEKFAEDHKDLKPFRTEWFVFSDDDTRISGSIDMTFISPMHIFPDSMPAPQEEIKDEDAEIQKEDGTVEPKKKERILWIDIWDWKRSKRIRSYNPWEKGFAPLDDLPNANFYQYAMQLNFYKWMVETFIRDVVFDGIHYDRIHVDRMYIVVFHPDNKRYIIKQMPDFQDRVKQMIAIRKEQLVSLRQQNHMEDIMRTSMQQMAQQVFDAFEEEYATDLPNRTWGSLGELERACDNVVAESHPTEYKALQDWKKLNPKDEFLHILCLVSLYRKAMRPIPVFEPPQTKPPSKRALPKPKKAPAEPQAVEASPRPAKSKSNAAPVPADRWAEVAAQLATLDPRRTSTEFVSLGPVTNTLKQMKPPVFTLPNLPKPEDPEPVQKKPQDKQPPHEKSQPPQ